MVKGLRSALLPPLDRAAFRDGARTMSAPALAIAAWGLVTGVALVEGGLTAPLAAVMTVTVFAGSAQLAVLPLLAVGAPLPVVWATGLLVNLRFVIFAAASRSYFAGLPWKQRLFAGYLNGDVGFALFMQRFGDAVERGTTEQWGFFYGLASLNWISWQLSSMVGIVLGGLAPTEWGLGLAAVLALVAVVIPMVVRVPAVLGVLVTGTLAVVTIRIPLRLGLLISVLAGVTVAVIAETRLGGRRQAVPPAPLERRRRRWGLAFIRRTVAVVPPGEDIGS